MTTLTLDRSSLAGHSDAEARGYAAFLADYLDREMGGEHRVRLGDGGSPPDGYREPMKDGWDAWCRMSEAEHHAWIARA